MATIVSGGSHRFEAHYYHVWKHVESGTETVLRCNQQGNLIGDEMPLEIAREIFADCQWMAEKGEMVYLGIRKYETHFFTPPLLECGCGHRLYLYGASANQCPTCGQLYDGSGTVLTLDTGEIYF